MASSVSEQEGVEAMLGLGLVAGAGGPADDPGEDEDDVPMIPGVMTIKGAQEDIVRRARACTGAARRLGRADRTRDLDPSARTHRKVLAGSWRSALPPVRPSGRARGRRCRSRRRVDTTAVWACSPRSSSRSYRTRPRAYST